MNSWCVIPWHPRYVFASFGKVSNMLEGIARCESIVQDDVLFRRVSARVGYRLANQNLGTMLLATIPVF